jgi:hypothetical protein
LKAIPYSPLFADLRGLLDKTSGLVPSPKSTLSHFGDRIELAFLYGFIAHGKEHLASDGDLMVVGSLKQNRPLARFAEADRAETYPNSAASNSGINLWAFVGLGDLPMFSK